MTDALQKILGEHFDAILYTIIGLVVVAVLLVIKLFHELRTETASTRKALRTLRGLVAVFRPSVLPKAGEPDPLAETMHEPIKAVKHPKAKP